MTESAPATAAGGHNLAGHDAVGHRGPASEASLGLAIAAAGAVIATVSCFLPWVRLDLGRLTVFFGNASRSLSGSAIRLGAVGTVAVVASIVMLLCSAAILGGFRPSMRIAFAWILAGAGVAVAAAAVTALATKGARADQVLRAAWQAATGGTQPAAQFDRLLDVLARLGARSSAGVGVYIAMVGGALGAIGGVLAAVRSARAARAERVATAARGFDAGWSAEPPA